MELARGVELAYLVQERIRCQTLLEKISGAVDVTMQTEGLRFTVVPRPGVTEHPELPHFLMRSMFFTGHLAKGLVEFIADLDRRLSEEFGITLEAVLKYPKPPNIGPGPDDYKQAS